MLCAYGGDTRKDNSERLLAFGSNHDTALLNIFFQHPPKRRLIHFQRGRKQETHRLHLHDTARQKGRAERCWPPSNVVSSHLGQQRRSGPCETTWPIHPQPPGDKGYKVTPQPAETDNGLITPGSSGDINRSPRPSSTLEGQQR